MAAEVRARYVDAIGVAATYTDPRMDEGGVAAARGRSIAAGLELRPLFPIRFLKNLEWGVPFPDLLLDSLGLELGAWWGLDHGAASRPGLLVGLGLEVPLSGRATGVWGRIAGSVRWPSGELAGVDPGGRTWLLTATLAWHQVLALHVVDAHDHR